MIPIISGSAGRDSATRMLRFGLAGLLALGLGAPADAQMRRLPGTRPQERVSKESILGRKLFFDTTLSNPPGQSCASCHAPEAGFRFPDSNINEQYGVATGAISTRFGSRAVPTISYAAYAIAGPPHAIPAEAVFVGGLFWDGHANDLADQARFPFLNPNEMNNLVHNVGAPELVVQAVQKGPSAALFQQVYGEDIFSHPTEEVYADITAAIAAFERTREVSPFASKFDAYVAGQATLTPAEMDGLRLVTGTWNGHPVGPPYRKFAQCVLCHGITDFPAQGPMLWTDFCYANIGVPRNPNNPYYIQTDPNENPVGYNPLGYDFVDLGLGDVLYPLAGLPSGNMGEGSSGDGDFLAINGAFKAPTLRNVDKRPSDDFVKSYMHNGVFKNLKDVVHFYNARNLTTAPGEVIDFTRADPYAGLIGTPLFAPPEVASPVSLNNPDGLTAVDGGQVGNLGLTDEEEDHIVAFLKTLTDD